VRVRGRARLVVLGTVLGLVVAVVAASRLAGDGPAVVVADDHGRQVASLPLPDGGRFALQYRHSIYRAEVTETFAATGERFRLVAVASGSEAVLDYYELDGPRAAAGAGWRLEPAATPAMTALPLIATDVGRRTLLVGDRRVPLFTEGGTPAHLVLTVRR
jgi:hypothetical protein